MLTTFYPPYAFGGDGIAVQRLARALARAGHAVTVVHDVDAYRALEGGTEPAAPADDDGVDVVAVLAARHRFVAVSDGPVVPEPGITLHPRGGLPMRLEPAPV